MPKEVTNFVALTKNPVFVESLDYVLSFYGPDAPKTLYPIKGLTTAIAEKAIMDYIKLCSDPINPYEWGDGDSIDRERVRDIILDNYGLEWTA